MNKVSTSLAFLLGLGLIGLSTLPAPVLAQTQPLTSVSQLSDVKPTDWAYGALQSLVERYGVVSGYPQGTFKGKQSLSRYEFAAALDATLNKVTGILTDGLKDTVTKSDIAQLKRLQSEFATELADIRTGLDRLEVRTAGLEATQFSTTTKLSGEAIFSAQSGTGKNVSTSSRVRLDLDSSFQGTDSLNVRLESGTGLLYGDKTAQDFHLTRLQYAFQYGGAKVVVGPILDSTDHIDTNSFANDEARDFTSGFFQNNPLLLPIKQGAGAAISGRLGDSPISLRALYISNDNKNLFGEGYGATAELEFSPQSAPYSLKFQFTKARVDGIDSTVGGFNGELNLSRGLSVFDRYGLGTVGTQSPQTWMAGIAFPDLFKEGAQAGIAFGQPLVLKGASATQSNLEAFYRLPVGKYISVTPSFQAIFNPDNQVGNTQYVGTLRTVFQF